MYLLQVTDLNSVVPALNNNTLLSGPSLAVTGIILIIATFIVLHFLKKLIVNTVLGAIVWAITLFFFKVELPLFPSLAVSIIFGPAGIGVMLFLKFFGLL